ncbi:hypothetical protein LE181_07805 [Streptomyces sp. SCA3-4]|uniref:hypothetical protein n=1 Tax=Streptomyces sichuanensis TaxID=2871810 RepID=UPI001CE3205B|nr:hypothetical protein [Streptomyces sichuanensis]MCA6092065.1 hypothetical protein [Streptomyces sichuanensis]
MRLGGDGGAAAGEEQSASRRGCRGIRARRAAAAARSLSTRRAASRSAYQASGLSGTPSAGHRRSAPSAPVSAKAWARTFGCAPSTVYPLRTPLTERGYLVRADGGYALGYRIPALHRSFQNQMGLDDGIHGLLARLRQATRASAKYVAYQATTC